MGFLTSKQLSEKWGIGQCRIIKLAREGRIEGARLYGKTWVFPEDAVKPSDGRRRATGLKSVRSSGSGKNYVDDDFFRYPMSVIEYPSDIYPPLTDEEKRLNAAVLEYHACDFDKAAESLGDLPETATNIYYRICALYLGCMIDAVIPDTHRFFEHYRKLACEICKDFPRKQEMSYLIRELDACLGTHGYFKNSFNIRTDYDYHESFIPHLTALGALSLYFQDSQHLNSATLASYELNCIMLNDTEHHADLIELHFYLGLSYSVINMRKEAIIHLRKAFELGEKYKIYFCIASDYYYMKDLLDPILSEFSPEFHSKINSISEDLHKRYLRFTGASSINTIYKQLSGRDYLYVFYAAHGYTNKEIAVIVNKTPSAVGMRLNSIYTTLGVKNKTELIKLYKASTSSSMINA